MLQNTTNIYFDNAATTPLCEEARKAMEPYWKEIFGNASSPYAISRAARGAVDGARHQVADLIGSNPDEIVFTSGGTESDNWALLGTALALGKDTEKHVILSNIEHPAILETAITLRQIGCEVELAQCDKNGVVQPDEIERLLRKSTFLVSLMLVNNETGVLQPVKDVARTLDDTKVLLHSDAVQAAGKVLLDVDEIGVDLMSLSGHKINGPKGSGALYVRRNTHMQSLMRGGSQERGRRAGTENIPAIVGFGAVAEVAKKGFQQKHAHLLKLRSTLENELNAINGVVIHGKNTVRSPHICNFSLPGKRAESIVLNLDLQGIAVGTGSACASGALHPSHVLEAMSVSLEEAQNSLRVSFGVQNTMEEVRQFVAAIRNLLK
ncbi:MAG: cysteine desulfurase family protein [Abditibacteriaceae bacterium]